MKKGKILVVDDENLICEVIEEVMEIDGFAVTSTTDGVEALKFIEDFEYDIVITDICMPKTSGIDLLNAVNVKNVNTQVILVTGFEDYVDSKMVKFLEPFAYITKPFDLEELVAVTNNAYHKRLELENCEQA